MTEIDLIAAGPWILFGIALAAVCLQLARSRRATTRRNPAGHESAVHRDHEEASCPEKKNTAGRRR